MTHRRIATASLLLLACACATPVAIERPVHEQELGLQQFQAAQQVFREQVTAPMTFDFPGHGTVTVRQISLDGFPGNTYVRCRFHLQNRTEQPIVQSWVSLDVLDGQGKLVASQASICVIPHPMALARGSFFADELRTQTFDAHLQPGWSWRIRCTSQLEEEEVPLVPPVPERTSGQPAPLLIQSRPQRWN